MATNQICLAMTALFDSLKISSKQRKIGNVHLVQNFNNAIFKLLRCPRAAKMKFRGRSFVTKVEDPIKLFFVFLFFHINLPTCYI